MMNHVLRFGIGLIFCVSIAPLSDAARTVSAMNVGSTMRCLTSVMAITAVPIGLVSAHTLDNSTVSRTSTAWTRHR